MPSKTDWRIISSILQTITSNSPASSTPSTTHVSQIFWHQARQGSVTLTGNEVQQFREIVRELLKDDATFNNFTVKDLENLLKPLILSILKAKGDQRNSEIEKQITELRNRLRAGVERWSFVIPIANLTLERKQLKIGNVRFFTFTDSHVTSWKSMFYNTSYKLKPETRIKYRDEICNNVLAPLKQCVCAGITVEAKYERASELALQEVRNALHVITMFFLGNEDFYRRYIGIKGEIVAVNSTDSRRNVLFSSNGLPGFHIETAGPRYPLELDKTRVDWMMKSGLREVTALIAKKETNSFEDRLRTAIYWLGAAMNVQIASTTKEVDTKIDLARNQKGKRMKQFRDFEFHNFAERLIKLIVALESLVILDEREPVASNLGERAAFLVAKKPNDRIYVDGQIKKLYRLRSRAIHHGRTEITHEELDWLSIVVQTAIIRLIRRRVRMGVTNDEEYRSWFMRNKFS